MITDILEGNWYVATKVAALYNTNKTTCVNEYEWYNEHGTNIVSKPLLK